MTKREREARFAAALAAAHEAGMAAGEAAMPTPMYVGTPRNLMGSLMGGDGGGFREDRPVYTVPDGPCGFAWVSIYAARGGMGRQLVNYLRGRGMWDGPSDYYGTRFMFVHEFRQSLVRKEAYAAAFAQTLSEALPEMAETGTRVYSQSRMD